MAVNKRHNNYEEWEMKCPECKTKIILLKMGNRIGGTCCKCGFKVS